jgi:predicted helicase
MSKRNKNLEIPHGVRPDEPFVQVLDPATGTGTFLVEAIDVIRRAMENRWHKQGHMALEFQNLWNEYVPKHLLPRIHGYELLMAPYAIAHMKIGLKLFETGYRFESDARARVYLTNSLEPADGDAEQISFAELVPALAHEAKAVSTIKRHQRFTVVIGNPPYSGISANMTEEAQELISAYRIVDGQALNEKKLWLQDDYVKFLRLGQTTIERAGIGVLGFITNHGYIDNPTFRGMRQSLMHTFQFLSVLDLHGNANKKEKSVDGSEDKNVFDIRQGVAICLSVRGGMRETVRHSDLWGSRDTKYSWLTNHRVGNTAFTSLAPDSPYYFFQAQNTDRRDEYDSGWKINEVMPVYSAGFITARDHFVVDFDRDSLLERIADFADPKLSDEKIRTKYFAGCGSNKYPDGDTRGWKVPEARKRVRADKNWRERVRRCLYRPFDVREVYWTEWMVDWPRPELTRHLDLSKSPALITTRITKDIFSVFVTALPPGHKSVGAYDVNYVFPLKTAPSGEPGSRLLLDNRKPQPNLAPAFLDGLVAALHSNQNSHPSRDEGPTAEDVFFYVYAVLHSPGYRTRYAEFLKIDFPRLPLTGNRELFRALVRLGEELVDLHLLKALRLDTAISDYIGPKSPEVEKISYARHAVWVDKEQTCGFKGVPEAVWDFHIGGYQVCEKWLKDRKGRKLSKGDVTHYNKIVVALSETIRLMKKIDDVIDEHGGWPGAFVTNLQIARSGKRRSTVAK